MRPNIIHHPQNTVSAFTTARYSPEPGVELHLNAEQVSTFQNAAWSASTRIAYQGDWNSFTAWCDMNGQTNLPAAPHTVAAYLAAEAHKTGADGEWFYSANTLSRRIAAINKAHKLAGHPKPGDHPQVATTLAGIRRTRIRPENRKAPLVLTELKRALNHIDVNTWPAGVIGHRDRAILLLGFAGAYRRSELATIRLADMQTHPEDGLHILLRKSKTDQEGRGQTKGIPYGANPNTCPPCAVHKWLTIAHATEQGRVELLRALRDANTDTHTCQNTDLALNHMNPETPLFRAVLKNGSIQTAAISDDVINAVVKRRVKAAGMNSVRYGAHSLRAGFVTQAFRAGATHHEVMRQTGHRSVSTVEGYSREHDPLRHNAVTRIGL